MLMTSVQDVGSLQHDINEMKKADDLIAADRRARQRKRSIPAKDLTVPKVRRGIQKQRLHLYKQGLILLQDNAAPHCSSH